MKRVCHVQVLPILSGVQRAMLDMFSHVDRSRYELHVACRGPGPLTDELERRRIRWHAIPALDRPIRIGRDWQAYRQLCRLFREHRFDIVHTHSSKPGILGRLAARHSHVPAVVHHVHAFAFHEFSPWHQHWAYSRLERWCSSRCDRLIFVNREERDFVIRQGWLPAEKCQTIYNGADLAALDPRLGDATRLEYRERWGASPSEVIILFVGRLCYPKQPLLIPEIAHRLLTIRPAAPWRLLVAGDGPQQAALARRIVDLRLNGRVELLGWQQDSHRILHAADVILMTSLAEGLPLALIEAQAAGLPIVAGNAKGVREVVTPGTGFLCPPQDVAAYAEPLSTLIDNSFLRKQLGRAARRHAEEQFDSVTNNCRIAAIYDELLNVNTTVPTHRRAAS